MWKSHCCYDCAVIASDELTEQGDHLAALMEVQRMFLCPDCGNKRCPKATNHSHDCSGSNEPGQPGSVYGKMQPGNFLKIAVPDGTDTEQQED